MELRTEATCRRMSTLLLIGLLTLAFNIQPTSAIIVLYDDFEDGVIDPGVWHIGTIGTGSVTEVDGYLRVYAGRPPTLDSHYGEAWAVAYAIDFKNFEQSTITFDLDWWKNYYAGGYIHIALHLTDGDSEFGVKEFNTNIASPQSGGGHYTLEIIGSTAHLYRDGASITDDLDISFLDGYMLKFYVYCKSLGGYVPGKPGFESIIHLYILEYECMSNGGVPEFPVGLALEILFMPIIIYIFWRTKQRKIN